VFSCNWDGWSCIDAATNVGLAYPASVNIIRLTCLSSIDAGLMLRSFEYGADGVVLIGCQQHECEHGQYGDNIEREFMKTGKVLEIAGLNRNRIAVFKLAPFDGEGFVEQLEDFIRVLAPRKTIDAAAGTNQQHYYCANISLNESHGVPGINEC
jgi:coenzyme F420-reducing hydrogenase delta subunit